MGPQAARKHPESLGKDPSETLSVTMNTTQCLQNPQPVSLALITLMIPGNLENNLDSDGISEEVRLKDVSGQFIKLHYIKYKIVRPGLRDQNRSQSSDPNFEFRRGVELRLKVGVQTRSSDQNLEFRPGIRVQIRTRSSDQELEFRPEGEFRSEFRVQIRSQHCSFTHFSESPSEQFPPRTP